MRAAKLRAVGFGQKLQDDCITLSVNNNIHKRIDDKFTIDGGFPGMGRVSKSVGESVNNF